MKRLRISRSLSSMTAPCGIFFPEVLGILLYWSHTTWAFFKAGVKRLLAALAKKALYDVATIGKGRGLRIVVCWNHVVSCSWRLSRNCLGTSGRPFSGFYEFPGI